MLTKINISDLIESPFQGRLIPSVDETETKNMKVLMESISVNGQLQPIVVRPVGDKYEIIDGHRRVEAIKRLGVQQVNAIVKNITDKEAQVQSVIANLQRENLHLIEMALAFKKILDAGIFKDKREFSKSIGKDETYVGDLLNTINMDKRIIDDIIANKTTNDVRMLRAIRKVENVNVNQESEKQWKIYNQFKTEKLNRDAVLALVKTEKAEPGIKYSVVLSSNNIHVRFLGKLSKKQRDYIRANVEKEVEAAIQQIAMRKKLE